MDAKKCAGLMALAFLAMLSYYSSPTEACMCYPRHPQTQFCEAEYVILIRVLRKSRDLVPGSVAYKVEIKKTYKKSDKSMSFLKHGRITTPDSESMCGVDLKIGRLYVMAGNSPTVQLCNYFKLYPEMSMVERRGMSGGYARGCACDVKPCFGNRCMEPQRSSQSCLWSPRSNCEEEFSYCVPWSYGSPQFQRTVCVWKKTQAYRKCLKNP